MKGFFKSLYKRKRINNLLIINPFLRAEDGAQTRDPQLGRLMSTEAYGFVATN